MKILMISPLYSLYHSGGLAYSCRRIAQGFAREKNDVHVLNIDAEIQYWDESNKPEGVFSTKDGDVNLHHITEKYSRVGVPLKNENDLGVKLKQWYLYLKDFVKKQDIDIIISFYITPYGYPASLVSKEFNIPLISAIRGNDIGRFMHDPLMIPLIKHTLENSERVVVLAKDLKSQVKLLCPKSKVDVIYNSTNPALLSKKWRAVGSNQKLVIGSTGIFKPKKGIEVLINALNKKDFEGKIKLLLVGDFSKSLTKKEDLIKKSKNELEITGIVKREEVIRRLEEIDIFVTLTDSDGCPNSTLEAMCLGRAILTTPVASMPDLLKDKKSAMFVDYLDEDLILEKIEYLLSNKKLLQKLGAEARKKAKDLLPPYEIESWLKIIKKIKK